MGNVFANGKEVSAKKTSNKSAPAMMSVCLSPPSPPAGPIPIPYPVTDMASNTTDGTGSVVINKKEVGKKNGSNYKKCNGNQPATRSFGMDVVSHTIQGKTKFEAYSFDVMFEKDGAERFMDLTSTNHMNPATAFTASGASANAAFPPNPNCTTMRSELEGDRNGFDGDEDLKKTGTLSTATTEPRSGQTFGSSNQAFDSIGGGKYHTPIRDDWCETVERTSSKGKKYKMKKFKAGPQPSNACGGKSPIEHPGGQQGRHAEMNILEKLSWKPAPNSITFAIDYPNAGNKYKKNRPCPTCQKTISKVCKCVGQIYICDEQNNPEPQCPPKSGGGG